jgi:hypothetical protein
MSITANSFEVRINRARRVAASGWVERDYEGFIVAPAGAEGEVFRVSQADPKCLRCSCPEFEAQSKKGHWFQCEHILAVRLYLRGEEQDAGSSFYVGAELSSDPGASAPLLSDPIRADRVNQEVEEIDGNGHEANYGEGLIVADLLDRAYPDWLHRITDIKQIGDYVVVVASITILGVTRYGIGIGSAHNETGIEKAEQGAFACAMEKFGFTRKLYCKDDKDASSGFPYDPVAKCMADLVTPKQLVAIRAIAKVQGVNAQSECMRLLNCKPEELSRRAASAFIEHLKALSRSAAHAHRCDATWQRR